MKAAAVGARRVRRLLVANRGEIARRVIRTAAGMGIGTVAVYAEGDAREPFVREADQAVPLGGRTAAESYLSVGKILQAARLSGADGVHPGYGFLSESPDFAAEVGGAGLVWVGPPPALIRSMADKPAAKELVRAAGVPTLELERENLTFPLLVKAAAGGGGRGMRIVETRDELDTALAAAAREAEASFGDGRVFLEPYLQRSRHVEVQVMADAHGNVVHLFERECSIQRRHQKILEECPSPGVSTALRKALTEAAVSIARTVSYESAGTVEFLVADDGASFYFLEMNTRLQVEHPVTEEVTGIDLVREQIRVAEGEPLSFSQADVRLQGHAIEVRLCAEDPARSFMPSFGPVVVFEPAAEPRLRWESGIEQGSTVSSEFDSMIAKVVVHAPSRDEAALRLALGLERTALSGPTTNRDYLVGLLRSPEFLAGDTTTEFVNRVAIAASLKPPPELVLQAAVAASLWESMASAVKLPGLRPGWRNSVMPLQQLTFSESGSGAVDVAYRWSREGTAEVAAGLSEGAEIAGIASLIDWRRDAISLELFGLRLDAHIADSRDTVVVRLAGRSVVLGRVTRHLEKADPANDSGVLVSPMPGKVVSVRVSKGDAVRAGQVLVVVEAMKMEHPVACPEDGVVGEVSVAEGAQVEPGTTLVVLERALREGV